MTFEERATKARLNLITNYPFWGQLAMYLKWKESKHVPTAAVDIKGNFFYNPEFVEKLDKAELQFVIAHELGHLFTKTHNRFPKGGHFKIWNLASDIVINIMLMDSGLDKPQFLDSLMTDEIIEKYRGMTTLEVYQDLMKDAVEMPTPMECTCGTDMEGASEKDKVIWKQRAVAAAEAVKARGKLPGALSDLILDILEPKVHWTDYLRVKTQQTMKRKWTWRLPSRRGLGMDLYLPGKHPRLPIAVVAVDTSGSISDEELRNFISECSEILRLTGGRMRVIMFDAEVYFDGDVEDFRTDVTQFQRGGTDFQVVMDHLEETEKPNLLVFFTDLYAPYPDKNPGYPVVWGLTPNHNEDPVPFGEVVVIEDR